MCAFQAPHNCCDVRECSGVSVRVCVCVLSLSISRLADPTTYVTEPERQVATAAQEKASRQHKQHETLTSEADVKLAGQNTIPGRFFFFYLRGKQVFGSAGDRRRVPLWDTAQSGMPASSLRCLRLTEGW